MATNNAVSFNQLKKSVFNMKNYVDHNVNNIYGNINKPYLEETEVFNFSLNINENGEITNTSDYDAVNTLNNGYMKSAYKTITDKNILDNITNSENKFRIVTRSNNEIVREYINMCNGFNINNYYPVDRSYPYIAFRIYKNYKYNEETKKITSSEGDICIAFSYIYNEETAVTPTTFNISFLLNKFNEKNISSFKYLKEPENSKFSITTQLNNSNVGDYTINLADEDAPNYSYVVGGTNTFGNDKNPIPASQYLHVMGYNNKTALAKHGSILGYNNNVTGYYTGRGLYGFFVMGSFNNFIEEKANNESYVGILGDHINAKQSGLFIGSNGTVPNTEAFALCNGKVETDLPVFSINRKTGIPSTIGQPTENNHLTTKKYVDTKVAGIVNSAPETLDTLQELATALGNDPNFATTVATQIGKKVDKVDGMSLTHNDLTNELKANYDAAYAYSQAKHSYNDLIDKPTIPSIAGLATEEYVKKAIASVGGSDVATDDEVKTAINAILGGDYIE